MRLNWTTSGIVSSFVRFHLMLWLWRLFAAQNTHTQSSLNWGCWQRHLFLASSPEKLAENRWLWSAVGGSIFFAGMAIDIPQSFLPLHGSMAPGILKPLPFPSAASFSSYLALRSSYLSGKYKKCTGSFISQIVLIGMLKVANFLIWKPLQNCPSNFKIQRMWRFWNSFQDLRSPEQTTTRNT